MGEAFSSIWQTEELYFRYSTEKSIARNNKEFHLHHELIFFMSGNANLITEKGSQKLLPYTLIVLPKNTFHQLVVREDEKERYVRCVFQFENVSGLAALIAEKLDSFRLIHSDGLTKTIMNYKDLATTSLTKEEKDALLHALFTLVLLHIQKENTLNLFPAEFHPITEQAIARIGENPEKIDGVDGLAAALRVSPSHLAHVFKADMKIALYQYILDKKLILAHEKIKAGLTANEAALESGFNDYSGFFRQYKKKFGLSPSETGAKSRKFDA